MHDATLVVAEQHGLIQHSRVAARRHLGNVSVCDLVLPAGFGVRHTALLVPDPTGVD
jgi:hypothetical protein